MILYIINSLDSVYFYCGVYLLIILFLYYQTIIKP
jgi:hypothetical protein